MTMLEAFEELKQKFTERREACSMADADEYFFCQGALFIINQTIDGLKHGSLREGASNET